MLNRKIGELLLHDYKGYRQEFKERHVLKAIITIGQLSVVGRARLGTLLKLGEGETRTLIRRMKENGMISVETKGCSLTKTGVNEYNSLSKALVSVGEVDGRAYDIGRHSWCIVVRKKSNRIRFGMEQRDAAVQGGAKGALILIYAKGSFRIPADGEDCERANPSSLWDSIRDRSYPRDGDVIIISGANSLKAAESGAWAAVIETIQK